MGVSEERFWDSSPEELKPYRIAYKRQKDVLDADMWTMGAYVFSAVHAAVDNSLYGKKSQVSYLDKPFSKQDTNPGEEEITKMSEEELSDLHMKKLSMINDIAKKSFGIKDKKTLDQGE